MHPVSILAPTPSPPPVRGIFPKHNSLCHYPLRTASHGSSLPLEQNPKLFLNPCLGTQHTLASISSFLVMATPPIHGSPCYRQVGSLLLPSRALCLSRGPPASPILQVCAELHFLKTFLDHKSKFTWAPPRAQATLLCTHQALCLSVDPTLQGPPTPGTVSGPKQISMCHLVQGGRFHRTVTGFMAHADGGHRSTLFCSLSQDKIHGLKKEPSQQSPGQN